MSVELLARVRFGEIVLCVVFIWFGHALDQACG
jgi:hypothetical protein